VLPIELEPEVHPFAQTLEPCILLQSFGVSHMKFGAEAEGLFRSLTSWQSVMLPQLVGFAKTMLLQLAGFETPFWTNSEKEINGLWILL